jgi:hypothetical protein
MIMAPTRCQSAPASLRKLLLDEETPQMRQLPRARHTKHTQLDQRPPDDSGVHGFGLIAEFGFSLLRIRQHDTQTLRLVKGGVSYSLEYLFPPDIL